MKVAFIIGTLAIGGAENVVSQLLIHLPDNIEKYLILSQDKVSFEFKGKKIVLGIRPSTSLIGAFKNLIVKWWKLRKLKKKYEFTHAISFMEGANIVNVLSRSKEKIIVTVRTFISNNEIYSGYSHRIVRMLIKKIYNKADYIIANSELLKKDLKNNFNVDKNKLKVIYNLFNIDRIDNLKREKVEYIGEIFKSPVLVTCGRLDKTKGHWYLIRIFHELKKNIPNLKLLLIGDGPLREQLIDLSHQFELKIYTEDNKQNYNEKDIYFLGFQDNPFKYIARSKLFILTSLVEGFPNVLVEAIACGVPVISTDCRSGPREILSPNTDYAFKTRKPVFAEYGILMPVFDINTNKNNNELSLEEREWVLTLYQILNDSDNYEKLLPGRNRAIDFSINKIINDWQNLIVERNKV